MKATNKLIRSLVARRTGRAGLEFEDRPVCSRHLLVVGVNLASILGETSDPCIYCDSEWTDRWKQLICNNPWMRQLGKSDVVYLSGPMSGHPDFNRPAFHLVEHAVRLMGSRVISPAYVNPDLPYEQQIRIGLINVLRANVCIQLLGWRASGGAVREWTVATMAGNRIYYEV